MAKPAVAELQHEDEAVRVTLWRFASSTETGWHVHEYDYVVVPVQGGSVHAVNVGGFAFLNPQEQLMTTYAPRLLHAARNLALRPDTDD